MPRRTSRINQRNMTLITDTDSLSDFCSRLKSNEYITVDTEFMREKTYWPKLCLIQVAGPDKAAAIDTLAEGMDLSPLYDLFDDTSILKVFHAARQDLEIFFHLTGRLPMPVFDTQVAAMVCGFGDSVGYEQLVSKLTKHRIDKSSRFTDWSLRPLKKKQLDYAISDVVYLRPAYDKLRKRLHTNGRESWTEEEMATLTRVETYRPDPRAVFRRIKCRTQSNRMLAVLRELAAWRETEAQRRDVPRNRVLRDETLVEMAHQRPRDVKDLARTRGLGSNLANGRYGRQILAAIEAGVAVPDDECPSPQLKPDLPRGIGPVADMLKVLLKAKCEQWDVANKLVASSADIDLIAAFAEDCGVPTLSGWRREVFGEDALKVRRGEAGLVINDGNISIFDVEAKERTAGP